MQNLRNLTNDELLNVVEAVPSYADNAELVAELARRLDNLTAALAGLPEDRIDVAVTFYCHRKHFVDTIQDLLDWIHSECFLQDIECPPEYERAKRALLDIPE